MNTVDGWAETYYRTEEDFQTGRNKVLPYAVNCKEQQNIGILTNCLKAAGFTYAPTYTGIQSSMTTFLVNLEFKKYAKIPYPVHFECVNERVYSIEEFLKEVFAPVYGE